MGHRRNALHEFAEIFDADKNGYIDRGEFFRFIQFLVVMSFVSNEDGGDDAADLDESDAADALAGDLDEAVRIDEVIENVRDDAAWADKILPTLPDEWKDYLTSDEFIDSAMDKFDGLDVDGNEKLSPDELVPVVWSCRRGSLGTSMVSTASSSPRSSTPTRTASLIAESSSASFSFSS